MDSELLKSVVNRLRYRTLDHLIGRPVEITDLDTVEKAIRLALGPELPDGCRLAGPELGCRRGTVARYGILDLRFWAPAETLACVAPTGLPLLRELGFLPGGTTGPQHRVCDDPTCLEMLQDDLDEGPTWLLLLLDGGRPGNDTRADTADGHIFFRLPEGYLPRTFHLIDACLTNARNVWLWKHFFP